MDNETSWSYRCSAGEPIGAASQDRQLLAQEQEMWHLERLPQKHQWQ